MTFFDTDGLKWPPYLLMSLITSALTKERVPVIANVIPSIESGIESSDSVTSSLLTSVVVDLLGFCAAMLFDVDCNVLLRYHEHREWLGWRCGRIVPQWNLIH